MTTTLRNLTSAVAVASALMAGAAKAEDIIFLAGTAGGTWHGLAGGLKGIVEANVPDSSMNIRPGGSLINLEALEQGIGQLGWLNGVPAVDAVNGKPPFEKAVKNVCAIGTFHTNTIQDVTTDPEIKSVADVRGKRVGTLPRGQHTEQLTRERMEIHGIKVEDLAQYNLGTFNDNVAGLKDGHIDVFVTATGIPSGPIMEFMSSSSSARFLPVSEDELTKLKAANAAWRRVVIPANTYPNQPEDVQSAGFGTVLGASCSALSEDLAYQITKAIIANYKDLGSVVHEIGSLAPSDIANGSGVPLHPGAERAYKEAGLM